MNEVLLGRTGIKVIKNGFGALPIQRIDQDAASRLMLKAFHAGWAYFDTARDYSDSEEKVGLALSSVRKDIILATKTAATNVKDFWHDLETSLRLLKTDYVDIYQFHNPAFCPKPGDESGIYDAMLQARQKGMLRFIGLTNHRLHVAEEAINSDLYDILLFPFCYLATEKEMSFYELCKEKNIGFVAMKALSGGLLSNSAACYAWMNQYDCALPVWGVQKESELDEFISYQKNAPIMDEAMQALIKSDQQELRSSFCRSCGYCMPCPAGIQIFNCARMSQLIRRSPSAQWLSAENQAMMLRINECRHCGQCKSRCPYGLDTPELLKQNLADYLNILSGKISV